jgi:hypothetical protein
MDSDEVTRVTDAPGEDIYPVWQPPENTMSINGNGNGTVP